MEMSDQHSIFSVHFVRKKKRNHTCWFQPLDGKKNDMTEATEDRAAWSWLNKVINYYVKNDKLQLLIMIYIRNWHF